MLIQRRLLLVLISFSFLVLQGCIPFVPWTYLTVKSQIAADCNDTTPPQITQTHDYLSSFKNIKKIAFRAPDSCTTSSASQSTGLSTTKQRLMTTDCGVVMAALEKALVKAGYDVYSWKSINNMVVTRDSITYVDAAKELGAEILFEVNSLEQVSMGINSKFKRDYLLTDRYGKTIGTATIPDNELEQINRLVNPRELIWASALRLRGAMLDLNAVDVNTNKKIWFYQWAKSTDVSFDFSVDTRFAGRNGRWKIWPRDLRQNQDENFSSEKGTSISREELCNKVYFEQIQEVVNDFALAFSSGRH